MEVVTVQSAPFEVNVHVVKEDGRALVVDATSGLDWRAFEPKLRAAIGDARVEKVYLTHLHIDHVGGAAALKRLTGAPVVMHADEADAVETGDDFLTGGALFGAPVEACPVERVREGDVVELGARRFEVLLLPGHSPAHTALWEPASRTLLSGDIIFEGGSFGRVDLPGGDGSELVRSLERLAKLEARDCYPGHMRPMLGNAREAILESLDNARLTLL